jgi:opacity protein-like surface antigen
VVAQYSDPEFTNYSYNWGVSADVITLYSRLDLARYNRLMIYVDLGFGMSFIQTHAYNETASANVIARDNPDYASKINYQFAYNAGAGLDYTLTGNIILSAGYSYQSFGNLSSGYGQGSNWGNARLNFGKLGGNMGLIGISYLV